MTDRAKIIDFYLKMIADKDFEISDVRKDLERNKIDEDEIKIIVKLVDNELQRKLLTETSNKRVTDLAYVGTVITLIGLIVTEGTLIGLMPMGNSFLLRLKG